MVSILHIDKLTFAFGTKPVLNGICVDFPYEQMTGILGPNGSGKTTLLRLLLKHLTPDQGHIFYKTVSTVQMSRSAMAKTIAYLPQSTERGFSYTVEDFVLLGRHPHIPVFGSETKKDYVIACEAMEMTEVAHLKKEDIRTVSGGEAQRVFFAQALAQEPKILVLDEPTNHLDLQHQLSILSIVRKLIREKSITVISVMHDVNLALEYCDAVLLLNNGGIHAYGSPESVITSETIKAVYKIEASMIQNPYTQKMHMVPAYTT